MSYVSPPYLFHHFFKMIRPALLRLVHHAAFCSLGLTNQGSRRLDPTFGNSSPEKLRTLLQSPLPPSQTSKCAFELSELSEAIQDSNESMFAIRDLDGEGQETKTGWVSPLEDCFKLSNDAVAMVGKALTCLRYNYLTFLLSNIHIFSQLE